MPENADHERWTHDAVDRDALDDDRYRSVDVDHEESIIYDQQVEEAWIQSDAVEPLTAWQ